MAKGVSAMYPENTGGEGASGLIGQRNTQFSEDDAARALLFEGAGGRVTAAANLAEQMRRGGAIRERQATQDAAKVLSMAEGGLQGPASSGNILAQASGLGEQADLIRGKALTEAAASIYGAEEALNTARMEEAQVLKSESVFAERQAKLSNFVQTMNGILADIDAGVITHERATRQLMAMASLEPDPLLRSSMEALIARPKTVAGPALPSQSDSTWSGQPSGGTVGKQWDGTQWG